MVNSGIRMHSQAGAWEREITKIKIFITTKKYTVNPINS